MSVDNASRADGRRGGPGTGVPRGSYAKGRATRRAIVAEAAKVFAQKGFYGASIRGIAREVGIDHTLLLHHFRDKTALLLAVIEWQDEQHEAEEVAGGEVVGGLAPDAAAHHDAAAQLGELVATVARRNAASPGIVRLLSVLSAEAGEPGHPAREPLQRRHDAMIEEYVSILDQVGTLDGDGDAIERGIAGPSDAGLTAEERAVLLITLWEGLQVFDALHPGRFDMPELLAKVVRQLA